MGGRCIVPAPLGLLVDLVDLFVKKRKKETYNKKPLQKLFEYIFISVIGHFVTVFLNVNLYPLWVTSGNTTWNGEALDASGASLQREAHGVWG